MFQPGAFNTMANKQPEINPAMGSVKTHEKKIQPSILQFIPLQSPLQSPTASVAPVIDWVLLTGRPK